MPYRGLKLPQQSRCVHERKQRDEFRGSLLDLAIELLVLSMWDVLLTQRFAAPLRCECADGSSDHATGGIRARAPA